MEKTISTNTQVIQKAYSDFGDGNIEAVLNSLTDDISWIDPGYPDIPFAGERNGKKQVAEFFQEMDEYIEMIEFEPRQFISENDNVAVQGYMKAKAKKTGKVFDSEWMMLWKVINGKIKSYRSFDDTNKTVKALQ